MSVDLPAVSLRSGQSPGDPDQINRFRLNHTGNQITVNKSQPFYWLFLAHPLNHQSKSTKFRQIVNFSLDLECFFIVLRKTQHQTCRYSKQSSIVNSKTLPQPFFLVALSWLADLA